MDSANPSPLFDPLVLPNGQRIPNRLGKAAMEEKMADGGHLPGAELLQLYRRWAQGGVGLILTGNVMIDPAAVTGAGGIILDQFQPLDPFRRWASAAKSNGAKVWMQINHPGRQVYTATNPDAIAPSAIPVDIEGFSHLFSRPREMTEADIEKVIERFATTAVLAEKAGFDGVQIHAAHGYLLSQFLSPLTNKRNDRWGGPLENRARILIEIVRAVRARVRPDFGVGVKLNSADFQRGGFGPDDAIEVVRWLNQLPVDLVELSGGSYESPAMQGSPQNASTREREAYFIDFARDIVAAARMPVMVTGGVRRRAVAESAIATEDGRPGVAIVGIGRALAYDPELPSKWLHGESVVELPSANFKKKALNNVANMAHARLQLRRMGGGSAPKLTASLLLTLIAEQVRTKTRSKAYRRWLSRRKH